jgi:calpain-15
MFTYGRANELWIQVLEKAYAKALGGYWNVRGRSIEEIIYDCTGCPCEVIELGVRIACIRA